MDTYWYCGIEVFGYAPVYSYISDEGYLAPGTHVMVPFGYNNSVRMGQVKTCASYTKKEAPYPLEKTKHILCVVDPDDYSEIWEESQVVDDLIDEEEWEEVFDWAFSYRNSQNEALQEKVLNCLRMCSQNGISGASLLLADLYDSGKMVCQNPQMAFHYYKLAADGGEVRGLCKCGSYCFYGVHQEKDYQEAYRYFSMGALIFEDDYCLFMLGDHYLNGYAVEKNENYGFRLYLRALDQCRGKEKAEERQSLADIQLRMGECMLYGKGTPRNVEEAHVVLNYALVNFYQRRTKEHSEVGNIEYTKVLILEAQEYLDHHL